MRGVGEARVLEALCTQAARVALAARRDPNDAIDRTAILLERERIKRQTVQQRRLLHHSQAA